jgi:hypothetical protein
MEEQLGPVAVTHLLQHTLRSLCTGGGDAAPQWVYAVFWRILPRNYPPPKCVRLLSSRRLLLFFSLLAPSLPPLLPPQLLMRIPTAIIA